MASSIPIINAGDGPGQHPTQALLDVYTIWKELGQVDDVVIGLVGDLAHGRTVRSLAYLLGKCYNNVKFYFVAPDVVKMKDDIKVRRWRHLLHSDGGRHAQNTMKLTGKAPEYRYG